MIDIIGKSTIKTQTIIGTKPIITDNLVLYLDAANNKSFRGEPTENVITNTNLDTGWSKGYNNSILWNDYKPPVYIDTQVVSFIPNNTYSYWYSYGDYAPQEQGVTYTISIWTRTLGDDFYIRSYTANNTEIGRYWSSLKMIKGDGKWYRVDWTFTNPIDSESDSLSFYFSNVSINQRYWLSAPQMEAKAYPTPFVNGIRGTTISTGGGWKNLIYNSVDGGSISDGIVFDNLIFGSLYLNNTTSYISFGHNILLEPPNITIIAWVKLQDINNRHILITKWYGWSFEIGANRYPYFRIYGSNVYDLVSTIPIVWDEWYQIASTFNDNDNFRTIYINGIITNSVIDNGSISYNQGSFNIPYTGNPIHTKGNISILKIYNNTLSETEILQNYNSTKNRYL